MPEGTSGVFIHSNVHYLTQSMWTPPNLLGYDDYDMMDILARCRNNFQASEWNLSTGCWNLSGSICSSLGTLALARTSAHKGQHDWLIGHLKHFSFKIKLFFKETAMCTVKYLVLYNKKIQTQCACSQAVNHICERPVFMSPNMRFGSQ